MSRMNREPTSVSAATFFIQLKDLFGYLLLLLFFLCFEKYKGEGVNFTPVLTLNIS